MLTETPYNGMESGFCFVGNFDYAYQKALPKFREHNFKAYGLPNEKLPIKKYLGIGIEPEENLSENSEDPIISEEDAIMLKSMIDDSEKCDVVWFRIYASSSAIPEGYHFCGYDITFVPGIHGAFSIINDCMFICQWHGCDPEGIAFTHYFSRLNENGLFDSGAEAICYMKHYLSFDWSERGEYCICEVFRKGYKDRRHPHAPHSPPDVPATN